MYKWDIGVLHGDIGFRVSKNGDSFRGIKGFSREKWFRA